MTATTSDPTSASQTPEVTKRYRDKTGVHPVKLVVRETMRELEKLDLTSFKEDHFQQLLFLAAKHSPESLDNFVQQAQLRLKPTRSKNHNDRIRAMWNYRTRNRTYVPTAAEAAAHLDDSDELIMYTMGMSKDKTARDLQTTALHLRLAKQARRTHCIPDLACALDGTALFLEVFPYTKGGGLYWQRKGAERASYVPSEHFDPNMISRQVAFYIENQERILPIKDYLIERKIWDRKQVKDFIDVGITPLLDGVL